MASHCASVTRGCPSPPTAKQSPSAYSSPIDSSLTKIGLPRGAVAALHGGQRRAQLDFSSCGLIGASSLQTAASKAGAQGGEQARLNAAKHDHGAPHRRTRDDPFSHWSNGQAGKRVPPFMIGGEGDVLPGHQSWVRWRRSGSWPRIGKIEAREWRSMCNGRQTARAAAPATRWFSACHARR